MRILFVCLGNICRSPTAEGVMRELLARSEPAADVTLDSAGTGAWHIGSQPDRRAREAARARGIELAGQARQIEPADFREFDLIIGMDRSNRANLLALAPDEAARSKVRLLREFDPNSQAGPDVPDPYEGGPAGFELVLDMVEAACGGLLVQIREGQSLPQAEVEK